MKEPKVGHLIYPTGFVSRSADHLGVSIVSEGDPDVAEVFKDYREGRLSLLDYANFKKALDNAIRLFGPGILWAESQRFNPNIDRNKAMFIQDTLEYIVFGKRRMHIRSWLSLTDDPIKGTVSPIILNGNAVHPDIVVPDALKRKNGSHVLAAWLSHKDGLSDLIESTNILFGCVPYTARED